MYHLFKLYKALVLCSFVNTPSKQTNKASPVSSATDISARYLVDREHVSNPIGDFVLGQKFNVTE